MRRGRGRAAPRRGPRIARPPSAILAAGGRGERTRSSLPKQFHPLAGRTPLSRSLDAVLAAGCSPCVVAVPGDCLARASSELAGARDVIVVPGGATRQESVRAALEHIETDVVVVHDAARPLVPTRLFAEVLAALAQADGAIAAMPVAETIKRVSGGRVELTIDRTDLVSVQTPQAFLTDVLRAAHEGAAAEGFRATDDAQLLERYGHRVAVVAGAAANIKLTFAEDFELAEALLKR